MVPPAIPPGFANRALQLLQKVQRGSSPIELVYTTHERWPLRLGHTVHTYPTLRVSVLDSSFNPPTAAHLALANFSPLSQSQSSASIEPYDARMLLLSVHNVDKVLKPGDASFVQRLEMMCLLANKIDNTFQSEDPLQRTGNVAVGIVDEPTFVGKSTLLLSFLRTRLTKVIINPLQDGTTNEQQDVFPSPKLTFLLGFDTLIRLFSPKYYSSEQAMLPVLRSFLSPDQQDCRIVCAYRQNASINNKFQVAQAKVLELAHEFIKATRITFVNIGTEEQTYSSSEVRAKVAVGDETWRQLVTDTIAEYIIKQQIYAGSGIRE